MNFVFSKKKERNNSFVLSNVQKYNFLQNIKNNKEKRILKEIVVKQKNPKVDEICETEKEYDTEVEEICETEKEDDTKVEEICETEKEDDTEVEEICEIEKEYDTEVEEIYEIENIEEKNNTDNYIDNLYDENIESFKTFDQKESLIKLKILINEILNKIEPEEFFDYKILIIKDSKDSKDFHIIEESQLIKNNLEYKTFSNEKILITNDIKENSELIDNKDMTTQQTQNLLLNEDSYIDKNDMTTQPISEPLINNEPTKLKFNMNKIKNITEKKNEKLEITNEALLLKMNNVVGKINTKLETEMNKDLFTFSEIMSSESSRKNILNYICLSVLNKIEKLF